MKININRTKNYKISEKQANYLYNKYLNKLDTLEKKGVVLDRLNKPTVIASIQVERRDMARKGRYASDIVQRVVDSQRYVTTFRRSEAISFRKALGSTEKISKIMSYDRQTFIDMHKQELKDFYNSIKSNPKAMREWNEKLGTNYTNAKEIMSNYFFGSK